MIDGEIQLKHAPVTERCQDLKTLLIM